jgi:hypothetical protein
LVNVSCSYGSKNKSIIALKCPFDHMYEQRKMKEFKFIQRILVRAYVTGNQQAL